MRVYAIVTGTNPLRIYTFRDFLVRVCTEKYEIGVDSLKNRYKHLTNTHFNLHNKKKFVFPKSPFQKDAITLSLRVLEDHYKQSGGGHK